MDEEEGRNVLTSLLSHSKSRSDLSLEERSEPSSLLLRRRVSSEEFCSKDTNAISKFSQSQSLSHQV